MIHDPNHRWEESHPSPTPHILGPYSRGASGKRALDLLKENPYKEFRLAADDDLWFGSAQRAALEFALFILEGFTWEQQNSDRFVAVHEEIHGVRRVRDHISWLLRQTDGDHFWPDEDEQAQLALIDFVRLLPYMWD